MTRKITASLLVAICLSIASCAAHIVRPVADNDKDASGSYDGQWRLTQKPLSSLQTVGTQRFRCNFKKRTTTMVVADGVGRVNYGRYNGKGNVSSKGEFFIAIPTDNEFSRSNGLNAVKNRITYIFKGVLSKDSASGLFVKGSEQLNNSGCSTRLDIELRK